MQLGLGGKRYGEGIILLVSPENEAQTSVKQPSVFHKVGDENTQNFLQSKVVSVLTCTLERGQRRTLVVRDSINHLRKGTGPGR